MTEEVRSIKQQLDAQAQRLKQAVTCYKSAVRVSMGDGQYMDVMPDEWLDIPSANVSIVACLLNRPESNVTVVNVRFGPGGKIGPHVHDRVETVFVLHGTYRDRLRGVELGPGGVDTIPAGIVHSSESDDALLTVTWKPAYETVRVDLA
jgi:quercetin dioxygenase-like cupin family protein